MLSALLARASSSESAMSPNPLTLGRAEAILSNCSSLSSRSISEIGITSVGGGIGGSLSCGRLKTSSKRLVILCLLITTYRFLFLVFTKISDSLMTRNLIPRCLQYSPAACHLAMFFTYCA